MSRSWNASTVTKCRDHASGPGAAVDVANAAPAWTWRASGLDALSHAFVAEGAFIQTHAVSALLVDGCGQCHLHEVEIFRSMCGREVPIAALMPHEHGFPCQLCRHVTQAPCALTA